MISRGFQVPISRRTKKGKTTLLAHTRLDLWIQRRVDGGRVALQISLQFVPALEYDNGHSSGQLSRLVLMAQVSSWLTQVNLLNASDQSRKGSCLATVQKGPVTRTMFTRSVTSRCA